MPTDAEIQAWAETHHWVGFLVLIAGLFIAFLPLILADPPPEDEEKQ